MFDAKKLLDALGTPATPAAAAYAEPSPEQNPAAKAKPSGDAKPPAPQPLGAGTLLSDLIELANRPDPPPPPADKADGPQPAEPPKQPQAGPQAPSGLTDLLLKRAQDYLKSPQGNATMNAVVVGLMKAVVNSEAGRKLTATAKSKGVALFNRLLNKGGPAPVIEGTALPPPQPRALPPPDPAGAGSGATALLVMRAMIAAAAADGRIDEAERERILGTLKNAGIDEAGVELIETELERPATVAQLAASVTTPEMAVQVYSAARRIITPNTVEERVFLAHLSGAMNLDPRTVAQIDAMASGAVPA